VGADGGCLRIAANGTAAAIHQKLILATVEGQEK
jgi:hypothetical protein